MQNLTGGYIMQNRRQFIKQLSWGVAGVSVLGTSFPAKAESIGSKLTIIHTNDFHSQIDPFPSDAPRFAGEGGMIRRANLIRSIRDEGGEVLLLDCGDIYQGTPYFNYYKGELELKLMSQMGYDGATIGNHEFDNGLEGIANQLKHAKFPFICSNYDFSDTIMNGKTIPFKVFQKGKIKVGVYGLGIELNGLVTPSNYGATKYLDPIATAQKMERYLVKKEKVDFVICLSHLGYKYRDETVSDVVIARNTRFTDVILGGHTHTFMDEPQMVVNSKGKKVVINQVGWGGLRLGRLDFTFGEGGDSHGYSSEVAHV